MMNMFRSAIPIVLALVLGGCTSTSEPSSATFWGSQDGLDKVKVTWSVPASKVTIEFPGLERADYRLWNLLAEMEDGSEFSAVLIDHPASGMEIGALGGCSFSHRLVCSSDVVLLESSGSLPHILFGEAALRHLEFGEGTAVLETGNARIGFVTRVEPNGLLLTPNKPSRGSQLCNLFEDPVLISHDRSRILECRQSPPGFTFVRREGAPPAAVYSPISSPSLPVAPWTLGPPGSAMRFPSLNYSLDDAFQTLQTSAKARSHLSRPGTTLLDASVLRVRDNSHPLVGLNERNESMQLTFQSDMDILHAIVARETKELRGETVYEKMVVVEESYDSAASSPKLDCLRAAVPLDVASRHVQKTLGGTLAALTVHYEDDLCAYSYAFQLRGTRLAPSIEMTYILDATTGRFAVIGLPASEMERIVNGPQ